MDNLHDFIYYLNSSTFIILLYLAGAYIVARDVIVYIYKLMRKSYIKIEKLINSHNNLETIVIEGSKHKKLFIKILNKEIDNVFKFKKSLNRYIYLKLIEYSIDRYEERDKIGYFLIVFFMDLRIFVNIDYEVFYKYRDKYDDIFLCNSVLEQTVLRKFSIVHVLDYKLKDKDELYSNVIRNKNTNIVLQWIDDYSKKIKL